jgi:hypothetical protein
LGRAGVNERRDRQWKVSSWRGQEQDVRKDERPRPSIIVFPYYHFSFFSSVSTEHYHFSFFSSIFAFPHSVL